MIVVEDLGTYPAEITELVASSVRELVIEREMERMHQLQGKSWSAMVGSSARQAMKKKLAQLLKKYSIRAFHATRVLDAEQVMESGLKPLEKKAFLSAMRKGLQTRLDWVGVEEAIALIEEYLQAEVSGAKQGCLWFYLTVGQVFNVENSDLTEYFGGRVLRDALHGQRFRYYPALKQIGYPAVFSCRVSLADAEEAHLEALAAEMLDRMLDEEQGVSPAAVKGELAVIKPLPAACIEGILDLKLQYA